MLDLLPKDIFLYCILRLYKTECHTFKKLRLVCKQLRDNLEDPIFLNKFKEFHKFCIDFIFKSSINVKFPPMTFNLLKKNTNLSLRYVRGTCDNTSVIVYRGPTDLEAGVTLGFCRIENSNCDMNGYYAMVTLNKFTNHLLRSALRNLIEKENRISPMSLQPFYDGGSFALRMDKSKMRSANLLSGQIIHVITSDIIIKKNMHTEKHNFEFIAGDIEKAPENLSECFFDKCICDKL
jgi:hypothetical protein